MAFSRFFQYLKRHFQTIMTSIKRGSLGNSLKIQLESLGRLLHLGFVFFHYAFYSYSLGLHRKHNSGKSWTTAQKRNQKCIQITSSIFIFSSAPHHQSGILGEGTEFQGKYPNAVIEVTNLSHFQKENGQKNRKQRTWGKKYIRKPWAGVIRTHLRE